MNIWLKTLLVYLEKYNWWIFMDKIRLSDMVKIIIKSIDDSVGLEGFVKELLDCTLKKDTVSKVKNTLSLFNIDLNYRSASFNDIEFEYKNQIISIYSSRTTGFEITYLILGPNRRYKDIFYTENDKETLYPLLYNKYKKYLIG